MSMTLSFPGLKPTIQPNGEHQFPKTDTHFINQIPVKNNDGTVNAVIEIGAGESHPNGVAKIETDKKTGQFKQDFKKGAPRFINFLPYPVNYGFIPQTFSSPDIKDASGYKGDGDAVDVMVFGGHKPTGTVQKIRVIGAIDMIDDGEKDTKVLGVPVDEKTPFHEITHVQELHDKFAGVIEVLTLWLSNYKNNRQVFIKGLLGPQEAMAAIDQAHESWQQHPYSKLDANG